MAADRPWMKFYPTDWRADQSLRVCSLGARGLWIECLCIMHEAEPYGHLIINGRPVTDAQLAALTGADPITVRQLLTELEEVGVSSRNRNGVIYSRRMTRDEKKRKDGEKAQKLGGKVPGSRRAQAAEKTIKNAPPPWVDDGVAGEPPSPQKPEARKITIEADASMGADGADSGATQSDSELVWGPGLDWLAKATGKQSSALRSLVGRWCKGGREAEVLTVMRECRKHGPPILDPIPWIEASLATRRKTDDRSRKAQDRPDRGGRDFDADRGTRRRAIMRVVAGGVEPGGAGAGEAVRAVAGADR